MGEPANVQHYVHPQTQFGNFNGLKSLFLHSIFGRYAPGSLWPANIFGSLGAYLTTIYTVPWC
jgi:hypothetical protein